MTPKTSRARGALLSLAALAALAGPAAAGENYILCGASPGGLWSLLGTGLDQVVKAEDETASVTYQTSSGGFANIVQIQQGKCDLGIIHVGEGVIAQNGDAPFQAPVDSFRAVAILYDWAPMQWVASKAWVEETGVTSIADLKEKKPALDLVVNKKGILPSILAERSLELAGVTFADIESWGGSVQYQGSKAAAETMKDGKADIWVNAMFVGTGAIRDIASVLPTTLLSVPDEISAQMGEEYGSIPWTVKAGSYDWLDADTPTFGARAALVVSDKADPATVKALTKAILDHQDKIIGVHKAMAPFDGKLMASLKAIPYHEGAIEAYKEAGLQ